MSSADAPQHNADPPEAATWIETYLRSTTAERDRVAGREAIASWSRLVAFVGIVAVWVTLGQAPLTATAISLGLLLIFAFTVHRHRVLQRERIQLDRSVTVAEESRSRLGGAICLIRETSPPPVGSALRDALPPIADDGPCWELTAQETGDLDLFSPPVGVFGLLNRTSTAIGADRLRRMLVAPMLDADRILARQAAVRWLADHPTERIALLAAAGGLRDENTRLARLVEAIRDAVPVKTWPSVRLLRIWSLFTAGISVAAIGLAVVGQFALGGALSAVLVINAILYFTNRERLAVAIAPWRDVAWAIQGLNAAAQAGAQNLPDEATLGDLRAAFAAITADSLLERLARRAGWSESGGFMALAMNLIVLAELHVAASLVHCALPHRESLLRGLAALAELEALNGLAAFAWEQPVVTFPQTADETCVDVRGGVHPLVEPETVIANDVRLDADLRLWVITGSNMAGKSTLLRMVGLNVVLAQAGGAVTARQMTWRPMRFMSDLRASDDLAKHESYFLAEVRHLRRMVLPPASDVPLLGLIDEPFRGTNSEDQTAASVAVARHLLASGNLFLLATHDRYLTEQVDGALARNYHFRENLGSAGMVFDYKLHEGPAVTRNALLILEREGYPASLMEIAHRWHDEQAAART